MWGILRSKASAKLVVALATATAVPDLEEPLLRIRSRIRTRARVHLRGAAKQRARSVATVVVTPHLPLVVAIAGRPRRTDANVLRRAMQAKFYSNRVCAREVRVVRVDEEPRRLGPGAHLAHDQGRGGEGNSACAVCVGLALSEKW